MSLYSDNIVWFSPLMYHCFMISRFLEYQSSDLSKWVNSNFNLKSFVKIFFFRLGILLFFYQLITASAFNENDISVRIHHSAHLRWKCNMFNAWFTISYAWRKYFLKSSIQWSLGFCSTYLLRVSHFLRSVLTQFPIQWGLKRPLWWTHHKSFNYNPPSPS